VSDRQRVSLKYTMVSALTSVITTGAFSYVFRGNSVFDPDFTSTGGQPANFDDYAALFNQYRVHGSTIKVHVLPTTSGTEPTMWVIGPRHISTSVTLATQMDFAAQPYSRAGLFNIYRAGAPDSVFTMSMTTPKFQGLSAAEFAGRDDLTALVSTNPAEGWFWHVTATNVDLSVTSELAIMVELVYDVEFFDRIDATLDLTARIERLQLLRDRKGGGRASGVNMCATAPDQKSGVMPPSGIRLLAPTRKPGAPGDGVDSETDEWVSPEPPNQGEQRQATRENVSAVKRCGGGSTLRRGANI